MSTRLGLLFLVLTSAAFAQTPQPAPASPVLHFEVVSIRPVKPDTSGMITMTYRDGDHNSHIDIENFDNRMLLNFAFGIESYQVEGMPKDLPWQMYNLHMSGGEDADAAFKTMSDDEAKEMRHRMLQEVLTERFHLQYHWVTKEMPSYLLVAGRQPKLHASAAKPLAKSERPRKDDPTSPYADWKCAQKGCDLQARGESMEWLAGILKTYMAGPVSDKTGMPGLWDFSIQWSMPWQNQVSAKASGADQDLYPPVEAAVADQLGLKIEHGKAPLKILVIDHIEPPTPN